MAGSRLSSRGGLRAGALPPAVRLSRQADALAAAGALVISTLPGLQSPAHAADWRTGWCQKDEGLSVVVDFGNEVAETIPPEGFLVRCLVGGVVSSTPENSRVAALQAVGLEVDADRSGYITSIGGVEEYSGDAMWWFFSGAVVPGPWDTGNNGIVTDGPNLNKASPARRHSSASPSPSPRRPGSRARARRSPARPGSARR